MSKYVKPSFIQKNFQLSSQTIRRWADEGKVKSIKMQNSGNRLIDYEDFLRVVGAENNSDTHAKKFICYARVSSQHQKEDLDRQIKLLQGKFPNHEIIKDIGSSLNYNRKGLQTLLELVLSNSVEQVVVTHTDRLSRFSFELLSGIFKKFGCSILVLNQVTDSNPELELSQDVLNIITYFTAKNNGMRSAKFRKERSNEGKKNKTVSNSGTETNLETMVRIEEMGV
jgi:putative resolvase